MIISMGALIDFFTVKLKGKGKGWRDSMFHD